MTTERDALLALLRRYGWNAISFQALEPGFQYWLAHDAAVAYVETRAARVVAGVPIADEARIREVAEAFVTRSGSEGKRVVFFAAERRFADAIAMRTLAVGLQPRWNPQRWDQTHRGHRSLREQLRRARAKGVEVRRIEEGDVRALRPAIERLIAQWLQSRTMPPMAFLVELRPFAFSAERLYFGAWRGGRLVGVLVAVPVYQRNGWFFEDLLRAPDAPNGTTETLVDAAMREVASRGATFATLGLVPLAGDDRWQRTARRWLRGFYNFEGLRAYRARLRPDGWDPVFLVWPGPRGAALPLVDALGAFAGGGLVAFAARAFFRAPPAALFLLGALAIPWAMLLGSRSARAWFPSEPIQRAWVAFDLTMAAALLALSRRWDRRLALATCAAAAADFGATALQVSRWNARRARGWRDKAVLAAALAAPVVVAATLAGGLRRTRRVRSAPSPDGGA